MQALYEESVTSVEIVEAPLSADALAILSDTQMNQIEEYLLSLPQTPYPIREIFIPKNGKLSGGMYVREVVLPPFTVFTTEIHNTRHPFVMSKGRVKAWTRGSGWTELRAPHTGITEPLTRRLITTFEEEVVWTTFHATEETEIAKIKEAILIPHNLVPTLR